MRSEDAKFKRENPEVDINESWGYFSQIWFKAVKRSLIFFSIGLFLNNG
jgi:hypothetical protein